MYVYTQNREEIDINCTHTHSILMPSLSPLFTHAHFPIHTITAKGSGCVTHTQLLGTLIVTAQWLRRQYSILSIYLSIYLYIDRSIYLSI